MDKYEYKLRAEEIRELVKEKRYQEALTIVENIDWNRVRGASMLTIASEVYKANRQYEESREILLLAYERHPGKRSIIFSLCELCLKMGDFIAAIKYYKEFVKVATKDSRRYILQYKIFESQDVSLEERIAVLEEYKRHDYRERWAYELAYLYHRASLPTKCVEECDELIVWFGEGKYVKKAMELKMLHQPLTSSQEAKYERMNSNNAKSPVSYQTDELDIKVKTMDMSKYNTINLQQELAECMQEFMRVTEDAEEENRKTDNMDESMKTISGMQQKKEETETFFEEETDSKSQNEQVLDAGMKEIKVEEIQEEIQEKHQEEIQENDPKIESMLHQGYDGQISLVVPEDKNEQQQVDIQITGQLCIKDILLEWERMKKKNEEKRKEDIHKRVTEQTCDMFSEFDAATKAEIQADLKRLAEGITSSEYVPDKEETADKLLDLATYKEEKKEAEIETEEVETLKVAETVAEVETLDAAEIVAEVETLEDADEMLDEEELVEKIVEERKEQPCGDVTKAFMSERDTQNFQKEVQKELKKQEVTKKESKKQEKKLQLSIEERKLFGAFVQTKEAKRQIIHMMDEISLVAYTGNIIITGELEKRTFDLAKCVIKQLQVTEDAFTGKVAKINAGALREKGFEQTIERLDNGAIIVEQAGMFNKEDITGLRKALQKEDKGILVVLIDTDRAINRLITRNECMLNEFNTRIDITELDNDSLVAYGTEYAFEQEYAIDEMGTLALYARIADLQTCIHAVYTKEVEEIVKEAIVSANRKIPKHFFNILFNSRYDEEDRIILKEKNFLSY